jgi:hypothetical protein
MPKRRQALSETMCIMAEIDASIPKWPIGHRCAGFVKPQRGGLAKPRPTAWVRESVFSDASPERAKQRCRTPIDDRVSRLIYYALSGLNN